MVTQKHHFISSKQLGSFHEPDCLFHIYTNIFKGDDFMDINKVNKAVSILEDSNRLLKGRMDELRHALKKSILPKDAADPYSCLLYTSRCV